jgi:hypothetical protein
MECLSHSFCLVRFLISLLVLFLVLFLVIFLVIFYRGRAHMSSARADAICFAFGKTFCPQDASSWGQSARPLHSFCRYYNFSVFTDFLAIIVRIFRHFPAFSSFIQKIYRKLKNKKRKREETQYI